MKYDYTAGQTGAIERRLQVDGLALDGTGMTVTLVLRDRARGLVPVSGKVAWLVDADGTVTYSPDVDDLRAERSPYSAKWKVTDPQGDDVYFPQGEAETWRVFQ